MVNKLRRILGLLLISISIGLLIYQFIPELVLTQKANEKQESLQNVSAEELKNNQQSDGEINFEAIDDISADMILEEDETDVPQGSMIAQLVIPSVGMDLPVYKSLTNQTLMSGTAIMRHDAKMGKGNYALAGHYTHTSGYLFGPLRHLKNGDIIRITDKDKIYEYETVDMKIVPSSATYMIEDQEAEAYDAPIISLMQCYYIDYQNTGDRQFFIGALKDIYDYNEQRLYS